MAAWRAVICSGSVALAAFCTGNCAERMLVGKVAPVPA